MIWSDSHLPRSFQVSTLRARIRKLTRDAELRIEDEFSGDLSEKIREALSRRENRSSVAPSL
jgi:polyphosphate kinase